MLLEGCDLGMNAVSLDSSPALSPFTGVRLWYDENNAFFSGAETGRVLDVDCPWATQAMADDVLQHVRRYSYQPFDARDAQLDPLAELGDMVVIDDISGSLAYIDTMFDAMCASNIGAPCDEEVDHEYPYVSPQMRAILRKVALGTSYYGARITRAKGLEVVRTAADGAETARVMLNSDVLAFYDADGKEALYFDAEAGKYRFRGDVTVTGGTMNINNNFIVDADGNLTINGNINLSGGTITWGKNNPTPDVSGILSSRYGITSTTLGKAEIASPLIKGNEIQVYGSFQCLNAVDGTQIVTGYMGAAYGLDAGGDVTYGVALARSYTSASGLGSNYVIVTDGGVRLQVSGYSLTLTKNGVYINGNRVLTTADQEQE